MPFGRHVERGFEARLTPAPVEGRDGSETLQRGAIVIWLLLLLSGSWSLARFDVSFTSWGFLAEARYWLGVGLAASASLLLWHRDPGGAGRARVAPWLTAVVFLHLYLLLSVAWSVEPERAWQRVPEIVLLCAVLVVTPTVFQPELDRHLDFLLRLMFWVAVAYVAAGMSGRWWEDGRMAAFGGGANVFSRIMGTGLLAAGYLWVSEQRAGWLAAVPFFWYGAVMSGSRGGLLAIGISGLAYLTYLIRRWRVSLGAMWLVAGLTLGLFYIQRGAVVAFLQRRFVELTFQQGYVTERDQLFRRAVEVFRDHPIFGVGLEGFATLEGWVYPHNLILHVATEGGLIGLSLMVIAAGLLLARMRRPASFPQVTMLACAGLYFVASMFSGGIYDARFFWLFSLLYVLHPESPARRLPGVAADHAPAAMRGMGQP